MSDPIFLLQDNHKLVEMQEQPFDSELFLQRLIAQHPQLLISEQLPRLALVSREMGIPTDIDSGDTWSMDHLFLDQHAILTVVEVKRSSDTRIRREVVGQMLDYAANTVAFMPIENIRNAFEKTHEHPEDELLSLFADDETVDYDEYWEQVQTNLQAGKMRLLFVADEIPIRLRQIVEFLNKTMYSVDVLAIEIKQYVDPKNGLITLVPRIVGQTAEAQRKKGRTHSISDAEVRQSVRVQLKEGRYQIDQLQDSTINVYHVTVGGELQTIKAMPMLKQINEELNLGISEFNNKGNPLNTRQLGINIIRQLLEQQKTI